MVAVFTSGAGLGPGRHWGRFIAHPKRLSSPVSPPRRAANVGVSGARARLSRANLRLETRLSKRKEEKARMGPSCSKCNVRPGSSAKPKALNSVSSCSWAETPAFRPGKQARTLPVANRGGETKRSLGPLPCRERWQCRSEMPSGVAVEVCRLNGQAPFPLLMEAWLTFSETASTIPPLPCLLPPR